MSVVVGIIRPGLIIKWIAWIMLSEQSLCSNEYSGLDVTQMCRNVSFVAEYIIICEGDGAMKTPREKISIFMKNKTIFQTSLNPAGIFMTWLYENKETEIEPPSINKSLDSYYCRNTGGSRASSATATAPQEGERLCRLSLFAR